MGILISGTGNREAINVILAVWKKMSRCGWTFQTNIQKKLIPNPVDG
jgi:hypothetical protein